jgi:hypothetical protein
LNSEKLHFHSSCFIHTAPEANKVIDQRATNVRDHGAAVIDIDFKSNEAGRSRASFCSSALRATENVSILSFGDGPAIR